MRESSIVDRTLKLLRGRGAFAEKIHGSAHQPRIVDILACYRGYFFAIEVKVPGKEPTARQDYTLKQVRDADGQGFWIDDPNQVLPYLEVIDARIRSQGRAGEQGD